MSDRDEQWLGQILFLLALAALAYFMLLVC